MPPIRGPPLEGRTFETKDGITPKIVVVGRALEVQSDQSFSVEPIGGALGTGDS